MCNLKSIFALFLIFYLDPLNILSATQPTKNLGFYCLTPFNQQNQTENSNTLQKDPNKVTKVFRFKYIKIGYLIDHSRFSRNEPLFSLILSKLSPKGEVYADFHTNRILVTDTLETIDKIELIVHSFNVFGEYYSLSNRCRVLSIRRSICIVMVPKAKL